MKVLKVTSGDDYAALQFENAHGGKKASEIINNLDQYQGDPDDEDAYWELYVYEVGEVSEDFVKFIRRHIQDHDDAKHTQFYMEYDTIGEE